MAVLERVAFSEASEYVEGWTNAAEIVGVNERTCKRRHELGNFPVPVRFDTIKRTDGDDHQRPVWRRRDLVAYAEGK